MWWIVCWAIVTAVGGVGTIASVNSVRFARRVDREVREMDTTADGTPRARAQWSSLPIPVQRYLSKALGSRVSPLTAVSVRHDGRFRTSLDGAWLPIRGQQFFRTDPPAFIWWGRMRMMPGLWVDARDRSVDGAGNMLVRIESTVTIADARGPELDQGALLRLLGEMAWFPTAFLDGRYVSWASIDDTHARATLQVNGRRVSGEFAFGSDQLPVSFSAERYRDTGGGSSALTPFVGKLSDFRPVDGVLVPHRAIAAWVVDGRAVEYADFTVRHLEYARR